MREGAFFAREFRASVSHLRRHARCSHNEVMSSRLAAAAIFFATIVPLAMACGSEDETHYGGPTGLSGKKVAPAPGETTNGGGSNPGAAAPCDEAGASLSEGGTCSVSWTNTIFAKYIAQPNGTWQCSNTNCHGPSGSSGVGVNQPTIDGQDATKAYAAFTQFTGLQGERYINACTTDPTGSAIDCNLKGTCTPSMPTTGAGVSSAKVQPAELTDLETWLACGAPLN